MTTGCGPHQVVQCLNGKIYLLANLFKRAILRRGNHAFPEEVDWAVFVPKDALQVPLNLAVKRAEDQFLRQK
jgi:hypothetical protein